MRAIEVDPLVQRYIVALVEATRQHDDVGLGASPRGSLSLFRSSQASALIQGRDYVLPDDVKTLAIPVLAHRIIVAPHARIRGVSGTDVITTVLEGVAVPGLRSGGWLPK